MLPRWLYDFGMGQGITSVEDLANSYMYPHSRCFGRLFSLDSSDLILSIRDDLISSSVGLLFGPTYPLPNVKDLPVSKDSYSLPKLLIEPCHKPGPLSPLYAIHGSDLGFGRGVY